MDEKKSLPFFADRLVALRTAAGLTVRQLADRAGLSPQGVWFLERGQRPLPQFHTVCLLARALGVRPEAFADPKDFPEFRQQTLDAVSTTV